MSTPETTYIRKHLFERLPEQSRRWWLLPQPFDVVTTSLSLGVLALFFRMVLLTDPASRSRLLSWWGLLLLIGATIGLLAIDRLEYRFYGEHTPRRVAVVLLAVRLLLTEVVVELTHMNLSPFLYLLLPFRAWLYFGGVAGTSLAGLLWVWCMSLWAVFERLRRRIEGGHGRAYTLAEAQALCVRAGLHVVCEKAFTVGWFWHAWALRAGQSVL